MGNNQSNNNSNGRLRSLFRSNSQEGLDPHVINAALEKAARSHPELFRAKHATSPPGNYHKPNTVADHPQGADGVAYFEEYEGNEPMDTSWSQQPLEPTDVPSLGVGSAGRRRRRRRDSARRDSSTRSMEAIKDSSNNDNSTRRRRSSAQDFAQAVSHMSPQQVLRNLEGFAKDDLEDADEYLHSLKNLQ